MENRRVNVRGIIWSEGKLLAVKHKNSNGSESDYWALPGGGLDPIESLTDGVARELREELGKDAVVGKLLFIQQFSGGKRANEELEFFYHIENAQDFGEIDLALTTHGLEELARVEFIDPATEHILPQFLSTIGIDDYITSDKPVFLYSELHQN